jgi:hypothetical protein
MHCGGCTPCAPGDFCTTSMQPTGGFGFICVGG